MKLAFFDDFRLGVVKGDAIVDVSAAVRDIPHTTPGNLISGLIENFAAYRKRLEDAAAGSQGVKLAGVRIRPPLPQAGQHRLHGGELHGERHAGGSRRRSTRSTRRPPRSSAPATPWCCPTSPPPSSRARPRWRW